jgi:hypothetical protein
VHTEFWWRERERERETTWKIGVFGRIILKLIYMKWDEGMD